MDGEFYIRHGGRTQGPFSVEKLHEMAQRGRFSRAYQVSSDRKNWQRASELPDLFPQAAPPRVRVPRSAPVGSLFEAATTSPADREEETFALRLDEPDDESELRQAQWYYTRNDEDQGPILWDQLQGMARKGQLCPDDQVWTEGMKDWVEASRVDELAELFPDAKRGGRSPATSPTGTAPMAVASLVLGMLGVTGLAVGLVLNLRGISLHRDSVIAISLGVSVLFIMCSILAVVFGHIASRQIRDGERSVGGRGLAVAGLILGYAVIVVTAVVVIVFLLLMYLGVADVLSRG